MQRLRSTRHRFWFEMSRRVGWSRGMYRETPALTLSGFDGERQATIESLQSRYDVRFELAHNAATSANNYEYLEILDRAWAESRLPRPSGGVLCDVGCASFWYAAALQAFFSPRELVGIDVEGHRLFRDGRTRIDYAAGYTAALPNARFVIADYSNLEMPADVVTAWFPFVTPAALLAWRLPLKLLNPERLIARIYHNLSPGGWFVMVNHGADEAERAAALCTATGFHCRHRSSSSPVLGAHRAAPAILSLWRTDA